MVNSKKVRFFQICFLFGIFGLTASKAFALSKKKTVFFPPQESVEFGDLEVMLSGDDGDLYQEIKLDPAPLHPIQGAFHSLGQSFSSDHLIWSSSISSKLEHEEARSFCQQLGEGARLPTLKEFDQIPDELKNNIEGKSFWTATYRPSRGYYFYSIIEPNLNRFDPPEAKHSVVCVSSRK